MYGIHLFQTFGVIRVPLFTMKDGYRGFPVFLANRFAGNARSQLIKAIQKNGILSEEYLTASYNKFLELNKGRQEQFHFDD